MRFKEFGAKENETMVLIHGLFVSWELFTPIVERLQDRYHLVVPMLDGHIYDEGKSERCWFSTLDRAAAEIKDWLIDHGISELRLVYGISLGGGVAARFAESSGIKIHRLVLDAAPILPSGRLFTCFCSYYQAVNCWCTFHLSGLYRIVFRSHYFRFAIDQVKKTFPSGGVTTPIRAYRSLYSFRLESLPDIEEVGFWYGSKEAWLFRRYERHLVALRPDTQVRMFPGMQHAQLVIDHPDEVARRLEK